jgi:hypothetical protein
MRVVTLSFEPVSSNQSPFSRKSDFWQQRQARQMGSVSEVRYHRDSTPAQDARKTRAVGAEAGNL